MKYALLTSSTKGIGKAIAVDLIKRGYFVFVNYFNDDNNANSFKEELNEYNNFKIIKADMTSYDSISVLYEEICKVTNVLDYVILNTSITCRDSFNTISQDNWNKVMNTNLNIPFFLLQKLYDMIRDNGRVIFIGAMLGTIPHAISIPYSISKAGINMLAKSVVKLFKPKNITSNVIAVGFADTDWHLSKTENHKKRIVDKIALNRFADVQEISSLVLQVIDNQYINGAILDINGGYDM